MTLKTTIQNTTGKHDETITETRHIASREIQIGKHTLAITYQVDIGDRAAYSYEFDGLRIAQKDQHVVIDDDLKVSIDDGCRSTEITKISTRPFDQSKLDKQLLAKGFAYRIGDCGLTQEEYDIAISAIEDVKREIPLSDIDRVSLEEGNLAEQIYNDVQAIYDNM